MYSALVGIAKGRRPLRRPRRRCDYAPKLDLKLRIGVSGLGSSDSGLVKFDVLANSTMKPKISEILEKFLTN